MNKLSPQPLQIGVALLVISLLATACQPAFLACSDPLGCVEIPADQPVLIGILIDVTGEQFASGNEILKNLDDRLAAKGNLLGHPFQLVPEQMDCTEASARLASSHLALLSDLVAVIGPNCSEVMETPGLVLQETGIPLLGPALDPMQSGVWLNQLINGVQQVAVAGRDGTLSIPCQALQEFLHISP